jgi:hypothetical protein
MLEPADTTGSISPARAVVRHAAVAAVWVALCAGAGPLGAQASHEANARSGTMHRALATMQQPLGEPDRAIGDSTASDVQREIEELAPLEEALHDVHGLSQAQSDSLAVLEQRYARVFATLAVSARKLIDGASSAGVAPNTAELRALCETVWNVRGSELSAARAMLTTRAQRIRFDANIAKIFCEESLLVEDLWKRTSGEGYESART